MSSQSQNKFPTTDWQMVLSAGGKGDADRRASLASLATLLARYEPIVRRYLRHQKHLSPEAVDDCVNGFIADKVLEQGLVARADQSRGRFRNFLVRSLENYLIDSSRKESSSRRAPHNGDLQHLDEAAVHVGSINDDPAEAFERTWAETVIGNAVEMSRQHCEKKGRQKQWQMFSCRILEHHGEKTPSYRELVKQFGFSNPNEAGNAMITCKRVFERSLRKALSEFLTFDDAGFQEEVMELRRIVNGSSRRF